MSCLEELLEIEEQSIEAVESTMRGLKNYLEDNGRTSMLPFLDAYLKITEGVIEQKNKGYFEEPEKLVKLDVRFAELYFKAVRLYIEKGEKKQPWSTYFNYIERNDSKPILELLLGINAHINSDLTQVLYEQSYHNKEDFKKVNKILRKSLYPVIANIGFERKDFESIALMSVPPVPMAGLKTIQDWRSLSLKNSKKREFEVTKLRKLTENNAEDLIELRHDYTARALVRKPFKALNTGVKL